MQCLQPRPMMITHYIRDAFSSLKHSSRAWFALIFPGKELDTEEKNRAEISRFLSDGRQVCFVTSYPRSGNTWLRYLLCDIFHQGMGIETTTILPVHPNKIIPDLYLNLIAECDLAIATPGLLVKTHETFARLKKFWRPSTFQKCKHLYIYRTPEDALVSFYHYQIRDGLSNTVAEGIDAFCRSRLPEWEAHLSSYLRAAERDGEVFFVAYEDLLEQPAAVLSDILVWLEVKHEDVMVQRAVANMKFDKLQAMDAKNPKNKEELFFRRGAAGSGTAELQPATLAEIRASTSHLIQQANSLALKIRSASDAAKNKSA